MRLALLALILSTAAFAQSAPMFRVENPDKLYNEAEAVKSYWYSIETVRAEYHILDKLSPTFTVKLGAEKDGLQWEPAEIHLIKWDKRMFRQGVIALTINELLKPENFKRLELRIEAQENAQVEWKALKK
jgi:hypothetical protein